MKNNLLLFLIMTLLPIGLFAKNTNCYTHTNFLTSDSLSIGLSVTSEISCNGDETGAIGLDITCGTPPYTTVWSHGGDPVNLPAGEYCVTVTDAENVETVECITLTEPDEISPNLSIEGIIECFGDVMIAMVSPTGGTGNYSIEWSKGQTNTTSIELMGGGVSVTVTDENGCTGSTLIILPGVPQLLVDLSMTPETDMDMNGTATAIASTFPFNFPQNYTYEWDTNPIQTGQTATDLSSGDYTVIVTAEDGCTTSGTIFVENLICPASGPTAELSVTSEIYCNGDTTGSIGIDIYCGTPPYSTVWSHGGEPFDLAAGEYCVTVTDAENVETVECITLTEPTDIQSNATFNGTINCQGDLIMGMVSPTGGVGDYFIEWSNGETGTTASLSGGGVEVTITDSNGCQDVVFVILPNNSLFIPGIGVDPETNMEMNGTATPSVFGGLPPYSYEWDTDPVQMTQTATGLAAGEYNVTVTDSNDCEVTTSVVVENLNIALVDCYAADNWTVHTENTSGSVYFSLNAAEIAITGDSDLVGTNLDEIDCVAFDGNVKTCITIPASGNISFDWSVGGGPSFNPLVEKFGYCLNDIATELTALEPLPFGTSEGSASIMVMEGDELCFINASKFADGFGAAAVLKNFVFPECPAPSPIVELSSIGEILCFGEETGAISIDITSGTPPYTTVWSHSGALTNLAAGEYCVTVTDAENIETIECIYVIEPGEIAFDLALDGEIKCFDDIVIGMVTPTGGTGDYSIEWDNGEIGAIAELMGGANEVTVTDINGCSATSFFILPGFPQLTVDLSMAAETNMDMNGTATASPFGGAQFYTYEWNTNPAQMSQTATGLTSGDYTVTVTDANDCTVSGTIFVDNMVGTREFKDLVQFQLFPNPSDGQVSIILELETAQNFAIQLFNNIGQQVSVFEFKNTNLINQSFDWTDLPKGLYWISIISGENRLSKKLIIE